MPFNLALSRTPAHSILKLSGSALRPQSTLRVSIVVAIYITAAFNQSLLQTLLAAHQAPALQQVLFMGSSIVVVFAVALIMISLLSFRSTFKTWLALLLLTGSLASYFMNHYHVVMNRDMIRNMLETDWEEARELFTLDLLMHWLLLGVLPAGLVALTPLQSASWLRNLGLRLGIIAMAAIVLLAVAFANFQDYASVFRNNRELRYLLVPSGYLYSLGTYAQQAMKSSQQPRERLGQDAHKGAQWAHLNGRKNLVIMVVGETARAQNFSLGGYERNTNPQLSQESVVYFNKVQSCGTSTAVSVPCLFSYYGRDNYDEDHIRHSDNLLDILQLAGVNILWRDNNSGCKGVCERIPTEDVSHMNVPELCNDRECFDMVLLQDLEARVEAMNDGGILILHQKGSHGPAYFLRSPKAIKTFTPECVSSELQQCSQSEIRNAYDNTIVYTDHVLSKLIEFLKQHDDHYNGALLYVSDHGESLSEGNIYLHGLPYRIAPEEQTHVPLLLWLSNHYAQTMGIDQRCLQQRSSMAFSHDNVFDTVLDLMNVDTKLHDKDRSLVGPCMTTLYTGPTSHDSEQT